MFRISSGTSATADGESLATSQDATKNKRLNRKIDFALLPLLSLLYMFNGLDRGNIGNAETQGIAHPGGGSL